MTELRFLKKDKQRREQEVLQLRTDEIRPNRAQPRSGFDQNALIRLTDSIRRYGILQPLTVRRLPVGDTDLYELIAGERRLRAAKLLGLYTVPCIVLEVDERVSAELAIIENLLREDLNMFEQACGFRRLIEGYGMTQEEVARKLSMSQSAVANKLRLLRLREEERRMVLEGGLTERHARALLKLPCDLRLGAIQYMIEKRLNVQESEQYIEHLLRNQKEAETAQKQDLAENRASFSEEQRQIKTKELLSAIRKKVRSMNVDGIRATVAVDDRPDGVSVTIHILREEADGILLLPEVLEGTAEEVCFT
ncbi:MAG: ParB/RepB/Spo0J family partition protein [Clostridia bacterium]|nr:ParB/RepB/Spo0J family partition protein [Clostridia bacterium]